MSQAGIHTIIDKIVNKCERPTIKEDCSPFFVDLIHACWDGCPTKRPTAIEILDLIAGEQEGDAFRSFAQSFSRPPDFFGSPSPVRTDRN
jgi:hypothetical protein